MRARTILSAFAAVCAAATFTVTASAMSVVDEPVLTDIAAPISYSADKLAVMNCMKGHAAVFDINSAFPNGCDIVSADIVDLDDIVEDDFFLDTSDGTIEIVLKDGDNVVGKTAEVHVHVIDSEGDNVTLVISIQAIESVEEDVGSFGYAAATQAWGDIETRYDIDRVLIDDGWSIDNLTICDSEGVFSTEPYADGNTVVISINNDPVIDEETADIIIFVKNDDSRTATINLNVEPVVYTMEYDPMTEDLTSGEGTSEVPVGSENDEPKGSPDTGVAGVAVMVASAVMGTGIALLSRKRK